MYMHAYTICMHICIYMYAYLCIYVPSNMEFNGPGLGQESVFNLGIPLLHPYHTLLIPLLHPYYTLITPLLHPYYTLITPLLHLYYTLITPLFNLGIQTFTLFRLFYRWAVLLYL
jgi:hypothetical protein